MSDNAVSQPEEKSSLTSALIKRAGQILGFMLIAGVILFATAGSLRWVWAWVYLGVSLAQLAVNALVLLRTHPELAAARAEAGAGTKAWDRTLTSLMYVFFFGMYIVPGLDYRFGWSPQVAPAIHLAALVVMVLAQFLILWAMVSNPFFEKSVRIQDDRSHTVATGGPYRFVRHPGYVGMIVSYLAMCLVFGSLWALIPAGLTGVCYVIRTALEDRTLIAELPGYAEYTQQTRYRLIPGVW